MKDALQRWIARSWWLDPIAILLITLAVFRLIGWPR